MAKKIICHLCREPIGKRKYSMYCDMIWHEKCLIFEAITDYVARQYGEYCKEGIGNNPNAEIGDKIKVRRKKEKKER